MHRAEQHLCELDCGRPAPHSNACHTCVDELEEQLNQFTEEELQRLQAIAYGIEKPALRSPKTKATKSSPRDVLNISAWVCHTHITRDWPDILPYLPTHPTVRALHKEITSDIYYAEALIRGEDENKLTPEEINQKMNDPEFRPRRPSELVDWFEEKLGLKISVRRIQKWREKRIIKPAYTTPGGHAYIAPEEILRALQNNREGQHIAKTI